MKFSYGHIYLYVKIRSLRIRKLRGLIMAKIKRNLSDKEKNLLEIISDAQSKLAAIQEKQKWDLGKLAYKNGLNEFDIDLLDSEFKKLATALANK